MFQLGRKAGTWRVGILAEWKPITLQRSIREREAEDGQTISQPGSQREG